MDLPIPVSISYKNLSSVVAQAESQKDLIASVIKKIEGQSKLILEYSKNNEIVSNHASFDFFWEAKCVVCYTVSENKNEIILNTVKKIVKNNGENATIYFDTIDLTGRIYSWQIDMSEVKPIIVHSGKNVKINFSSDSGIAIQSSGKSLKNAARGDLVRVQISNWFLKNSTLNSTEIIEAKVIAPDEVEYVSKQ